MTGPGSLRIDLIYPDTIIYPDSVIFPDGILVDETGKSVRLSDITPAIRELTEEEATRAIKLTLGTFGALFPNLVAAGIDVPLAALIAFAAALGSYETMTDTETLEQLARWWERHRPR